MLEADPNATNEPATKAALGIIMKSLASSQTPGDFANSFMKGLGTDANGGPNAVAVSLQRDSAKATRLGCSLLQGRMESPKGMLAAADTIARAGIPVLIVTGGYSKGQEATGDALARILHGRHVVVPSPNHFVQESNPADFNRVVDAFMREADASSRSAIAGKQ